MITTRQAETYINRIVRFVDEQAVIEAQQNDTKYPKLYWGRIRDILTITVFNQEIPYVKIEPMWTTKPTLIPMSHVWLIP